ncbi:MAG: hypothetical protein ABJZ55_11920 [Fuerstiella sp.]
MCKQLLVLAVAALTLDTTTTADDSNQSSVDARNFATKMLKIYQTKEVKKLLDHSTDGPATPRMLQRLAPGSGRYNSLFGDSSWRWKAVKNWNGKLAAVKYHRTAMVQFTKGAGTTELGFVTLVLETGKWKFQSIDHMTERSVLSPMSANFKLPEKHRFAQSLHKAAMPLIKAHQEQNTAAVLKSSSADGPAVLQYLKKEDEGKPKSELLFSKKNMQGVADWDGKFRAIYMSEMARVEFARNDSEVFVVTLQRDSRGWKFEDIHSPDVKDFEALND